jgi:hypothetical protein
MDAIPPVTLALPQQYRGSPQCPGDSKPVGDSVGWQEALPIDVAERRCGGSSVSH